LIAKELAKQLSDQAGNGLAVIYIAGRDAKLQDFAAIIDHQVQFETKEPAGGGMSAGGQPGKDLVGVDALVETDIQRGRVDERDSCAVTQSVRAQVHDQQNRHGGNILQKAGAADQPWKLGPPGLQHLFAAAGFEVPVVRLVKGNQNGHDLTGCQLTCPLGQLLSADQHWSVPDG